MRSVLANVASAMASVELAALRAPCPVLPIACCSVVSICSGFFSSGLGVIAASCLGGRVFSSPRRGFSGNLRVLPMRFSSACGRHFSPCWQASPRMLVEGCGSKVCKAEMQLGGDLEGLLGNFVSFTTRSAFSYRGYWHFLCQCATLQSGNLPARNRLMPIARQDGGRRSCIRLHLRQARGSPYSA